jgi:pyruvate/2-oxoglutarate dehydrogenase complex dihydrolipoamide dehydrogenase (E3) component
MADAFAVHEQLETRAPRSAVIIGGGYIGIEMADALTRRGLSVTAIEHAASVLKTVDPGFGTLVSDELQRHGIRVKTNVRVERIDREETRLQVIGSNQFHTIADLVLVGVGVEPNANLAHAAGIEVGERGAIRVTRKKEATEGGGSIFKTRSVYHHTLPNGGGSSASDWPRFIQHATFAIILYKAFGITVSQK